MFALEYRQAQSLAERNGMNKIDSAHTIVGKAVLLASAYAGEKNTGSDWEILVILTGRRREL